METMKTYQHKSKFGNCEICNDSNLRNGKYAYEEPIDCYHYLICTSCLDKRVLREHHFYHGQDCIYCIMDGKGWDEDCRSWNESANGIMDLLDYGFEDSLTHDKPYKPSRKVEKNTILLDGNKNNIYTFRKMYEKGFQYGKQMHITKNINETA